MQKAEFVKLYKIDQPGQQISTLSKKNHVALNFIIFSLGGGCNTGMQCVQIRARGCDCQGHQCAQIFSLATNIPCFSLVKILLILPVTTCKSENLGGQLTPRYFPEGQALYVICKLYTVRDCLMNINIFRMSKDP